MEWTPEGDDERRTRRLLKRLIRLQALNDAARKDTVEIFKKQAVSLEGTVARLGASCSRLADVVLSLQRRVGALEQKARAW